MSSLWTGVTQLAVMYNKYHIYHITQEPHTTGTSLREVDNAKGSSGRISVQKRRVTQKSQTQM